MNTNIFSRRHAAVILIVAAISGCAGSKPKETQHADTAPRAEDSTGKSNGSSSSYKVISGDNLWNIAGSRSVYGDPYKWPLIYKANKSRISDADLIYPGQIFDIDRSPSSAETGAAVKHARTRGAWSLGSVEPSDRTYLSRN
jgi:nucleoid-associated protein YgaU